ncbi:hypothetical protein WR25_06760 [Diploscapter pachys]|uniref:HORMA domain-containing protein n=1 Tax=Diploscapter pachys TaxID=2018661 RepID=A0A2A2K9U1_9BILA|nr:hypothetical protein WR25_06760 [Diploscapter pachys]
MAPRNNPPAAASMHGVNEASAVNPGLFHQITSKEWNAFFPSMMTNPDDSFKFISRCLCLTFSHIMESRYLMKPSYFKKRKIDGNIRAWMINTEEPLGRRLMEKLKGACDAIRKGYMDEFFLVVSQDKEKPDEAIEVYRWKMHYDQHGNVSAEFGMTEKEKDLTHKLARLEYKGAEQVRLSTIALIFAIRKLCRDTLKKLPPGCVSTFRMVCRPETPSDYMAPGFHNSDALYSFPEGADDVQSALVGSVRTGTHCFALSCESLLMNDAYDSELKIKEINDIVFKSVANGTSLNNSLYLAIKDDSTSESSSATIGTGSDTSVFGQIARTEDEAEESSRKRNREEELEQPEERTVKKQKVAGEPSSSKRVTIRAEEMRKAGKEKKKRGDKPAVEAETSTPKKMVQKTHIVQQPSPESSN